jgi:sulfate transport system permease protein
VGTVWLSLIVLVPLAAVTAKATDGGLGAAWQAVSSRQARSALELTIVASLGVAVVNAVFGTLIAWVLVRDGFRGKSVVNALIDLPFALPTIVAGITLLALYGPNGPLGINIAYTRAGVTLLALYGPQSPLHVNAAYTRAGLVLALLFVTLPFVVRSVQPVLIEADREMEEAAASLGASPATIFRRIVLPTLRPAIISGAALGFARAVGEFGSVVLISGNIPFHTQVASVLIYQQIESDAPQAAAAVSVVLLLLSVIVLLAIRALGRARR